LCRRAALSLAVVLAVILHSSPVASATPLFQGFDATCQSAGWNCASAGYSDASAGWWDTWYYAGIHNCTRYAAYRLAQNGFDDPGRSWGAASEWGSRAPGVPDGNPAVGAIAWWAAGTTVGGGTGHVAYVEEVGDGYFIETEDNADPINRTRKVTVRAGTESWPTAFLHIKDVASTPPPANPKPDPVAASGTTQPTGVYVGTIGGGANRVPATLTLTNSDPITGTIDLPGICTATWTESQRLSDFTRMVNAHVTSGTEKCRDNQWAVTINMGQINGVDSNRAGYTVSLTRQ
jgi:surface antigen